MGSAPARDTPVHPRRDPAALALVGLYTLVFWGLLPVLLWLAGTAVDRWLGWRAEPTWLGAVPLAAGAWLVATAIGSLWRRGRGWPVGALPPPRLVISGPYLHCRHPLYLGFDLAVLGVGLVVGSPGLAFVVAPLFLPLWMLYGKLEERGLARRFGPDWDRYARHTPLLPRPSLRLPMWLLSGLGILRVRVLSGQEHLPPRGPVVVVANHSNLADPVWLALAVRRRLWMSTTAEAYRGRGAMRFACRHWPTFPLRRYRPDPSAVRRMLDLLGAGEAVGLFVERERSVLGEWLGVEPHVAAAVARLGVPVVPVALQDAYAVGPRWAGTLRVLTVHARVGPPLDWSQGTPQAVLDAAFRGLLDEDPQRVLLEREPLEHLHRAVWRCPACLAERGPEGWQPEELRCAACGGAWAPDGAGRVRDAEGRVQAFADWARPVWQAEERGPLQARVRVLREEDPHGPLGPLQVVGEGMLTLDRQALRWPGGEIPLAQVRSVSTERADTLQIGTTGGTCWQLHTEADPKAPVSCFRLARAVEAWRPKRAAPEGVHRLPVRPPEPAPVPGRPWAAAAVGLGVAVAEGLTLLLPLSRGHGAAGLAADVLPMTALYGAVGAGIDLLARRLRAPPVAAGLAALALVAGLAVVAEQEPVGVAAIVGLAGLWALAASLRPTRFAALAVAAWALSTVLPRPAPPLAPLADTAAAGPDIVVVVLDTVRRDRTALGGRPELTPHLAALASRGVSFPGAHSTSCWTLPAHASLLTGLLPARHGAHYEHLFLSPEVPVLTEELRAAGYETAAFSANPLVAPGTGLGRGFTTFEEAWRRPTVRSSVTGWRIWHALAAPERDKGGADLVAALRRWRARRDPERPAFVLVNIMEAHAPYQEVPRRYLDAALTERLPARELERLGEAALMAQVFGTPVPEADRAGVQALADGAVQAADAVLGEVRAVLGDEAWWVVLADHGELFGEHDGLWGHDLGLSEPLLQVPLVIAPPGGAAPRVVEGPVSLVDLAPTLRGLAGLPAVASDGEDLGPALEGAALPANRPLYAHHFRTRYLTAGWALGRPVLDAAEIGARRAAVLRGGLKRVRSETGRDEGFDLAVDPGEAAPFAGERTGLWLEVPEPGASADLPPLDPAAQQALEALGYVR